MSLPLIVLLAVISGSAYALMGVAFRCGEKDGIAPLQVMTLACTVGFLLFLGLGWREFAQVDVAFCFWGLVTGVTQYGVMKLLKPTLARGPLSPMWCALMLGFVPTIVFAWLWLGETLTVWSILATLAAIGAVVAAAGAGHTAAGADRAGRNRQRLIYGLLLVILLLLNGEANIANKGLQTAYPNFGRIVNVYLCLLYLGVIVPGWTETLIRRNAKFHSKYLYGAAAIGATATIGGLFFQNAIITAPAALVFTVISASSILAGAVMSVLFFGEKRTLPWYLTLLFALLAIAASQGQIFWNWIRPEAIS